MKCLEALLSAILSFLLFHINPSQCQWLVKSGLETGWKEKHVVTPYNS